jgi:tRNA dimethylallyltransferase
LRKKTIIIITGPTAVGKTSLSLRLAAHFNTAIISADSRQCFREMSIGVAKPSPGELQQAKHYFINSHSVNEKVDAAIFESYALHAAKEIFATQDVAVMVGGTGLYIKAFCEGLDEIPTVSDEIRAAIVADYNSKGLEWLQSSIQQQDPAFWAQAEQQNPQRLMRALEVITATGKSILSFRKQQPVQRDFNIIKIGLELPRELLYANINLRVEQMVQQGLPAEVMSLIPYRNLNALQTVGYQEIFDHLDGKYSLKEAIGEIQKNTRHYAKRQMTWFKKDTSIQWLDARATNNTATIAERMVQ